MLRQRPRPAPPLGTTTARLLLVLALSTGAASAQNQVGSLRYGPQSPNAASLSQFGEVPVSHYTGTPSVSIPILTLRDNDVTLPISLDYHASGVRVSEIGGTVGVGWALSAGGAVTRSVVGQPDDNGIGFMYTGRSVYSSSEADLARVMDIVFARADGDPDRFFYNVAGEAGEFAVGPTSATGPVKVIPLRRTPLAFSWSGSISEWFITGPDGTRYTFGAVERTFETSAVADKHPAYPFDALEYPSAWYLTSVQSPVGASGMTLTYTDRGTSVLAQPSSFQELYTNCNSTGPEGGTFRSDPQYEVQNVRTLASIQTSSERVRFEYSLRTDAKNAKTGAQQSYRVDRIVHETLGGQRIRTFTLGYTYLDGRLFLTSVTERGETDTAAVPPYTIEYNTTALPSLTSLSLDHWGYSNGAGNSTLLPAGTYNWVGGATYKAGADRAPHPTHALARMLRKITYPTGGSTTFEFEPNDYSATVYQASAGEIVWRDSPSITASGDGTMEATLQVPIPSVQGSTQEAVRVVVEYMGPTQFAQPWPSVSFGPGSWPTSAPARGIVTYDVTVPVGTHTLRVRSYNPGESIRAYVSYREYVTTGGAAIQQGGGVRIKSVANFDGTAATTRRFGYRLSSNGSLSSGVLASVPGYSYAHQDGVCTVYARTGSSYNPVDQTSGSPVGYREVTETVDGVSGKTVRTFRSPLDAPPSASPMAAPTTRLTNIDWRRGQPLTETVYNGSNGVVHQRTNTYAFEEPEALNGLSIVFFGWQMATFRSSSQGNGIEYIVDASTAETPYKAISGWAKKTREVESKSE